MDHGATGERAQPTDWATIVTGQVWRGLALSPSTKKWYARALLELAQPTIFYRFMDDKKPPPPWRRWLFRCRWKWDCFRRWLSRLIYDWDDYY